MAKMIGKNLQRQQGGRTRGLENLNTWVLISALYKPLGSCLLVFRKGMNVVGIS